MSIYGDVHRLFLQIMISKRIVSEYDAQSLYIKVAEQLQVDAPIDQFQNFILAINKQLESLSMAVRRGKAEESGFVYYALINCYEDEYSKLATDYSPQEIEFIKAVLEVIVRHEEGQLSSIDLIHLGRELPKRVTSQAAEDLLSKLTEDMWLVEIHGKMSFGPRAVIELGQYIKNKYPDQIVECQLCHDFVISGDLCLHCGIKIHKYCSATAFHGMIANRRKCPSCKEPWENELITLPKTECLIDNVPEPPSMGASQSKRKGSRRK